MTDEDIRSQCEEQLQRFFEKHILPIPIEVKPQGINLTLIQWAFRLGFIDGARYGMEATHDKTVELLTPKCPPPTPPNTLP